jgi:hypothetical protein
MHTYSSANSGLPAAATSRAGHAIWLGGRRRACPASPVDLGGAEGLQPGGGAAVLGGPLGPGDLAVGDVADQHVAEAVLAPAGHGRAPGRLQQLLQEVEQGVVGPVQVLQDQHQRPRRRQPAYCGRGLTCRNAENRKASSLGREGVLGPGQVLQ